MARDLNEVTVTRQTIRREVLSQACRSPITLTSAIAGSLVVVGGVLTNFNWWWLVAGGLLAPTGFLFNFLFRANRFSHEFVDSIAKALNRRRQKRLGEIRADLYDLANELSANNEAGDLASRALEQFGNNQSKFDLFLTVLDRKLVPGELAHARYLSAADQFFMKVMEHLVSASEALQVVALTSNDDDKKKQIQRVENLLTQNSEALAAFDKTIAAITSMKDLDASESEDLQFIKDQLEQLARQAERLDRV